MGFNSAFNPLTPSDHYSGRTARLSSKRCILYIYSTNIGTGYFKHGIYSPVFFLSSKCSLFHNSNVFGSCFIHILYTGCAKIKKIISAPKGYGLRRSDGNVALHKSAQLFRYTIKNTKEHKCRTRMMAKGALKCLCLHLLKLNPIRFN